jgi:4-amino-4-deoxy-L-arabinose transferase-like glycosyltransferase
MVTRPAPLAAPERAPRRARPARRRRRPTWPALLLAGVLALGVALRLWGVKNGLPFVYDLDERRHFVDIAVQMYRHGYNPHYFQNPPGFTYLLHAIDSFAYGGLWPRGAGPAARAQLLTDPTPLFVMGRIAAGVLGVGAAGAAYFVAKRLYGVVAGLVAATLLALTFLPVAYGHIALNDVPTLLPLTVGLLGVVLVYERGTWPAYLLAGAGVGVAAGFKYTAAALAVPVIVACALRVLSGRGRLVPEALRLIGAGAMALASFFVVNPFALLSPHEFKASLEYQQRFSSGERKLGLEHVSGWRYYAWTLTWGFGWAPLGLAAVGAVVGLKRDWRKALLLLSFIGVFYLFMGSQTRFFARYLLPVYPFLAVLAGYGVAVLIGRVPRGPWRPAAGVALVALALVQPLVTVVHNDRVLSRTDTRELARRWLLGNLPNYAGLALDKIDAPGYARVRHDRLSPHLWQIYPRPGGLVENYENHLYPSLLDKYAAAGACTVVTGSIQRDRAFKDPQAVPYAIAYYKRLEQVGTKVATFSPVKAGAHLPTFNFDWSYDYYPLAYARPGPLVEIYRLRLGGCAARRQGSDPLAAVAFAHEDDVRRR